MQRAGIASEFCKSNSWSIYQYHWLWKGVFEIIIPIHTPLLITGKSIPHSPLEQKKKYPHIYTTRILLDTKKSGFPWVLEKNNLPLISFPWSYQKEGHTLMCIKCTASKKEWRQKQKLAKGSNKENIDLQGWILCAHDKKLMWCIPTCWVNCIHSFSCL